MDIQLAKILYNINDDGLKPEKKKCYDSHIMLITESEEIEEIPKSTISNAITSFNKFLKNMSISKEIEEGIRQYAHDYCGIDRKSRIKCFTPSHCAPYMLLSVYNTKCRDILAHIDPKSSVGNKYFSQQLKKKELKRNGKNIEEYYEIAYLTPQELCPEKWQMEIDRRNIREEKSKNIATSNLYTCGVCKGKKTYISPTPVQLRSPDEPMTIYVECANPKCGKRFRV